jgi:hypothetical protein
VRLLGALLLAVTGLFHIIPKTAVGEWDSRGPNVKAEIGLSAKIWSDDVAIFHRTKNVDAPITLGELFILAFRHRLAFLIKQSDASENGGSGTVYRSVGFGDSNYFLFGATSDIRIRGLDIESWRPSSINYVHCDSGIVQAPDFIEHDSALFVPRTTRLNVQVWSMVASEFSFRLIQGIRSEVSAISCRIRSSYSGLGSLFHLMQLGRSDSSVDSGGGEGQPSTYGKPYLKGTALCVLCALLSLVCFWNLQFSDYWQRRWQWLLLVLSGCFCGLAYGVSLLL